jgi:hypothetical protein
MPTFQITCKNAAKPLFVAVIHSAVLWILAPPALISVAVFTTPISSGF